MKKNIRVIPRLDIKGPNLVKGIHMEGLRVLGEPEDFAKYYYKNYADELIFIDVVASLYDRNSLHDIIKKTSSQIFIPITVGGGLRTIDDIKKILRVGADKISLNTAAIKNPNLIKDASLTFGSSTIVISIEVIKHDDGNYYAYTDNGREFSGKNAIEWAKEVESLGAGEINVCSVDKDGTKLGYDLEINKIISNEVKIPVIAHGGAGKLSHFSEIIDETNIDAISFSSLVHYNYIKNNETKSASSIEGNIEFLKKKNQSKISDFSINDIKKYLVEKKIKCRV